MLAVVALTGGGLPRTARAQVSPDAPPRDVGSAPAAGKPPLDRYGPRNALSLHPWSLFGPGVALQYERYAFPRWVSVATGLGLRASGQGDYRSVTFSTALEGRFWMIGRAPFSTVGDRAMVGPFVGARVDATWTRIWHAADGRAVGNAFEHAETAEVGSRLVFGPVEATPFLGAGVTTQHDPSGRLAALTGPVLKVGLTLGVMF